MISTKIQKLVLMALFTLSASVFAEDKWNSYYIGASSGAALGDAKSTDVTDYNAVPSSEIKYNTNGAQLSIFGGKNWLLTNNFLIGTEAAIGYMNISNKKQFADYVGVRLPTDSRASTDNGMFISLAGRFGKLLNDNTLIYSKAGFIQTDIRQSFIDEDPTGSLLISGTKTTKLSAPFVGLGLEYSFYKNLNILAEYIHYQFGSINHTAKDNQISPNEFVFNEKLNLDTLNLGITYNF
jgi:opacity protein-like surface antigen